jgi:DNA polymerase-1
VKNTYGPIMVQDNQLELYEGLMLSSLRTIIQMELTGMPINVDRVQEVKLELSGLEQDRLAKVHGRRSMGFPC